MSGLDLCLRRWRLQRLRALALEQGLWLFARIAGALLVFSAADALWALPQGLRLGAFAALCAFLLVHCARKAVRIARALSAPRLLGEAGRAHESVREHLLPAWELSRAGVPAGTSKALAEEHARRTERLLAAIAPGPLFPFKASRRTCRGAALAAMLWLPGAFWLGRAPLSRVLLPWRDARIEELWEIRPSDARLPWGSSVELSARRRASSSSARERLCPGLRLRGEGGRWQAAAWDSESDLCVYRIPALTSVLDYRLESRQARSAVYRLTPVPFVRMKDLSVRVRLPGGRTQESSVQAGAEIAALRGSWVTLSGAPDQALSSAALELSFSPAPVRMSSVGAGRWEASFLLRESGSLRLRLVSEDGLRDPDPIPFPLRAVEDLPPVVDLLSPGFDLEISPRERLPVAYEARDDYGLRSAALVYRVGEGAPKRAALRRFEGAPMRAVEEFRWDLSELPADASVEFWVEAADDASPAQTGVSRRSRLKLSDFDASHARLDALGRSAEAELEALAASERESALRLKDASFDPAGAEALEAALARKWDSAQSALDRLAQSAEKDPYANPGMQESAQAAAQALKEMRAGESKRAAQASRSGRMSESAQEHEKLAGRLEKAAQSLRESRGIQQTQDLWMQAHRMDQAGRELESALEEAASSGRAPSAQESQRLEEALSDLRKQMEDIERLAESLPKFDPASLREQGRKIAILPMRAARRSLDAVQEALAKGDYAAAARAARRMSEELARMREALAAAAKSQTEESEEASASRELERAMDLWKDAVEAQARSLRMTQELQEERMKARRREQEELLRKLAALQSEAVREAESIGAPVPPDAAAWMRQVLREFEAARVERSPEILDRTVKRLSAQAAALRKAAPEGQPPASAASLDALSKKEDDILSQLRSGEKEPARGEEEVSRCMGAAAVQGQARRKTEDLSGRMEELAKQGASWPKGSEDSVKQARQEQQSAEGSLSRGSPGSAQKNQEKALELLEQGLRSCQDAQAQQQSRAQQALSPFGRPRGMARPMGGLRGRTGAEMGFVPLPGAQEYQPPREIRREVERSLRERRPDAFDPVIRDYLKRMSQ